MSLSLKTTSAASRFQHPSAFPKFSYRLEPNQYIQPNCRAMSSSKRVFGQATRQGPTRYQRQLGGSKGNASSSHSAAQLTEEQERAERRLKMKLKRRAEDEACDERFGYCRYSHNSGDGSRSKRGWIFNILPTVGFSTSI
jgi:hypothetical protein